MTQGEVYTNVMKGLLRRWQGLGFAVAETSDVADELARLVGDAHFDRRELGMVEHLRGFGAQVVALLGARYEHHAVADAEGELAAVVHEGGNGEIGQCEQGTALAYVASVEVGIGNGHLGHGVLAVELGNPTAGIGGKTVVTVQEFLYVHFQSVCSGKHGFLFDFPDVQHDALELL